MQAVGAELGLSDGFFSRMWDAESGKGQNLRGPLLKSGEKAEGHFQVLPSTRATFEKRLGRKLDPDNFYDGLELAKEVMKENLGRFKNEGDATAAYNGGWDPKRWGNKETVGYVSKVAGGGASRPAGAPADASGSIRTFEGESELPLRIEPDVAQETGVDTEEEQPAPPTLGQRNIALSSTQSVQAEVGISPINIDGRAVDVSTGVVFQTARRDPEVTGAIALAAWYDREDETPPPGWTYAAHADEYERPFSGDDVAIGFLRRNISGPVTAPSVIAEAMVRRDNRQVYADAGILRTLAGQAGAASIDPTSWFGALSGYTVFRAFGIGSKVLAASGRVGSAYASAGAEAALGEVALTAAIDASGETVRPEDYVLGATIGGILGSAFARGDVRAGYNKFAQAEQERMVDDILRYRIENPNRDELAELNRQNDENLTNPLGEEQIVPLYIQREILDEADGIAPTGLLDDTTTVSRAATDPLDETPPVLRAADDPATVLDTDTPRIEATERSLPPEEATRLSDLANRSRTVEEDTQTGPAEGEILRQSDSDAPQQDIPDDSAQAVEPQVSREIVSDNTYSINHTTATGDRTVYTPGAEIKVFRSTPASGLESIPHSPENLVGQSLTDWLKRAADLGDPSGGPLFVKRMAARLLTSKNPALDTTRVVVARSRSFFQLSTNSVVLSDPVGLNSFRGNTVRPKAKRRPLPASDATPEDIDVNGVHSTILHEAVHATTLYWIESVHSGARVPKRVKLAVDRLDAEFNSARSDLRARSNSIGVQYAGTNLHEFVAQAMSDVEVVRFLSNRPPAVKRDASIVNAFRAVLHDIGDMLGLINRGEGSSLAGVLADIDILMRSGIDLDFGSPKAKDSSAKSSSAAPPSEVNYGVPADASGAAVSTQGAGAPPPGVIRDNTERWVDGIVQQAEDLMRRNPIDPERLRSMVKLLKNAPSAGLKLASNFHPVAQAAATFITEVTTGAAGRKVTVALRQDGERARALGNFIPDYEATYEAYRKRTVGSFTGLYDDAVRGEVRRDFDKQVGLTIRKRRKLNYKHPDADINRAADFAEQLFERTRRMQVDNKTIGSANLPPTSVGYIPQSLDGHRIHHADDADVSLLSNSIAIQFTHTYGWSPELSQQIASDYIARQYARVTHQSGPDMMGTNGSHESVLRQSLDEFASRGNVSARQAVADLTTGTPGRTKKRFDIDMDVELRPGLTVGDFYVQDVSALARSQAHAVSATVALGEKGIHGMQGIALYRQALTRPYKGRKVDADILQAFDQVIYELTGSRNFGDGKYIVQSEGANNLRLLFSWTRLGSLVFSQFSEAANLASVAGIQGVLKGVVSLPRNIGELRRIRKTGAVASNSPLLSSIELVGGKVFGAEGYRMNAPLDAPNHELNGYMDQPGVMSRILRLGTHSQSVITGYRALVSAQHRAAAEQVVLKAMRFINESTLGDPQTTKILADIGLDRELVGALKADMQQIAVFDSSGTLVKLDLSKATYPSDALKFTAAVHRSVGQIIQGTFAGERSVWFHNDYMQLVLQLRTFSLTAMEKQITRQVANRGHMGAAMLLVGQVAAAIPIHLARVHLLSAGREDREEYIDKQTTPGALVVSLLNYASISGLYGDMANAVFGVLGGWNEDARDVIGARVSGAGLASTVPVVGLANDLGRTITGQSSLYSAVKQSPFASAWFVIPILNTLKE
jgi:hypothetical protein